MISEILILCAGLVIGAAINYVYSKTKLIIHHGDWNIYNNKSVIDKDVYYLFANNSKNENLIIEFYKNGDVDIYCDGEVKETIIQR